jgi:alpha-tubulin suppressor-like RCC1 family protein
MSNLILIDQSVPDKEFIISNKLENTQYLQIDAIKQSFSDCLIASIKQSFSDLYLQIEQLNIITPITNIGLIKVNDFRFFGLNTVNIEQIDPNLDQFGEFINFLTNLKNNYGMINFDIITCNLYNDDWKYIIDTVKNKHNITIRTSSNITGKYGDWILESDGTNLVGLYFNENINNYQYSLDLSTHTIVIDDSFNLWGCGSNTYGQLGLDNLTNTLTLMTAISGKTPIQVACGASHTIVLMSDRSIYSCGANGFGQLGIGNTLNTNTLTLMTGISGKTPIQVACRSNHTVVLMSDGSIYSCGYNIVGQLGTGNTTNTNTLTLMTGISGKTPIQVECGDSHTIVLMSDGSIYGCGNHHYGQLGTGNTTYGNTNTLRLINPISGKTPIQVACGTYHTTVLMSDGSIYGCGDNYDGELGTGDTLNTNTLTLMTGISGKTPIQVACGDVHTAVLMSDGSIYGCGYNHYGQLGTGDTSNTNTLTLMTGISGKTPIQVACGDYYTAVLMSDGSIYGCGYNRYGELGTGDTSNTLTLMTGISGKTPIQVACGGYYTAVLMSDGSIYSCGYNNDGALGTGNTPNTNRLTAMIRPANMTTPILLQGHIYENNPISSI